MTVKIVALLNARPGMIPKLEDLLASLAPACRAEPGNLGWEVWRDKARPERFVLNELYKDDAAVTAHRQSPHFLAYLSRVADLADRESLVLEPMELGEARPNSLR